MPLYTDVHGRKVVYWLSQIGVSSLRLTRLRRVVPLGVSCSQQSLFQNGAGPLILSWINEICSDDTEKRALLVAAGNDFAYVVQAVVGTDPSSYKQGFVEY